LNCFNKFIKHYFDVTYNITNYTELTNRMQEFELKVLEKTSIIPNPEDINGKTR
jgi:hypothetical protein